MIKTRIFLSVMILFLFACSAEKSLIKKAREQNTIEGYEQYLAGYEHGKYAKEAIQKIRDIQFSQMRDSAFFSFIHIVKTDNVVQSGAIRIDPSNEVLMGTPVGIELHHLAPNQEFTLHACRRQWKGFIYAFAAFQSDSNGKICLDKACPIRGTYKEADPLGIFWSMSWPSQKDPELPFVPEESNENTVFFCVESDNRIIAKEKLELIDKGSHIDTENINNDTLTAIFHYPHNRTKLPLVILLSGSEGGYRNISKMAKIIASNGYAVLALAYFGLDPLPEHLEKIPLEYFYGAIDWMKKESNIDSTNIVIAGGSRGGELALLLASQRKDIKGVIAVEPSCVLWQGLPHNPLNIFFPKPAWTLNGKPLPFLKHKCHLSTYAKFGSNATQIELMVFYKDVIENRSKIEPAWIKVERINGPILLIAGKDGRLWPSYSMCQMMESRLDSLNYRFPVECLYYENAGHYVTITPDLSPTIGYKNEQIMVGGTDSGNACAQIDSWNRMLDFLNKYFPADRS